jgi:hypothetical protein
VRFGSAGFPPSRSNDQSAVGGQRPDRGTDHPGVDARRNWNDGSNGVGGIRRVVEQVGEECALETADKDRAECPENAEGLIPTGLPIGKGMC